VTAQHTCSTSWWLAFDHRQVGADGAACKLHPYVVLPVHSVCAAGKRTKGAGLAELWLCCAALHALQRSCCGRALQLLASSFCATHICGGKAHQQPVCLLCLAPMSKVSHAYMTSVILLEHYCSRGSRFGFVWHCVLLTLATVFYCFCYCYMVQAGAMNTPCFAAHLDCLHAVSAGPTCSGCASWCQMDS
jgi:hypothetical protein